MNDPSSVEEWMKVARERGKDADAMLPARAASIGPIYMAGYAIECAIKGYMQQRRIRRPSSGREGHNLRGLWSQARFRLSDLKDTAGTKSFFIKHWTTGFRYQTNCPPNTPNSDEAVRAAKEIVGWIQAQINRLQARKNDRKRQNRRR